MTTDFVTRWQDSIRAGDADSLAETLAENVVLVSPLTDTFDFRGRGEVVELMHSVLEVFTGISFSHRIDGNDAGSGSGNGAMVVLIASGTVRGRRLDETQVISLDADGRIARIELFMRPLPAVTGLLRGLGTKVPRRQGRRLTSAVLTVAGGLLDGVATSGDKVFVPMGAPRR